jgi:hypothetical protein
MKLAVPTCEPRAGRLGPIFAVPTTAPSTSATTVCPGGFSSHSARASSEVIAGSNA